MVSDGFQLSIPVVKYWKEGNGKIQADEQLRPIEIVVESRRRKRGVRHSKTGPGRTVPVTSCSSSAAQGRGGRPDSRSWPSAWWMAKQKVSENRAVKFKSKEETDEPRSSRLHAAE